MCALVDENISKNIFPEEADSVQEVENSAGQHLKEIRDELKKTEEALKYLSADFENYRRNVAKERAQWMKNAQAGVLRDILGVVDDFERGLKELNEHIADDSFRNRIQGIELIYKSFLKLLHQHEVKEIDSNLSFDPRLHEAVVQVAVDGKEQGSIVQILQKGYMHKDSILRPAKVSVAQ